MSKDDILFVKGMDYSDSDTDEDLDIWDDSKLNDAYDKALLIASAEVAKRVAMSTNTPSKDDSKSKSKSKSTQQTKSSQKKATDKVEWKVGMHCRAAYDGDGNEYEASLLRLINNKECVVRFLGYENSEIVSISSLKPSLGKTERTRQIEEALLDKMDEHNSTTKHPKKMDSSDRAPSPGSSASFQTKKKSEKKKNKPKKKNLFDFPEMEMPNISKLLNLGAFDMPIAPPPLNLRPDADSEDQAVSSMLLSWYMSGYYTGLYQGMKRAKERRGSQ